MEFNNQDRVQQSSKGKLGGGGVSDWRVGDEEESEDR